MEEVRVLTRNEILAGGEPAIVHAIQSLGDVECDERSMSELFDPLFEYVSGEERNDFPEESECEAAFELFGRFEVARHEGFDWFAGGVYGSDLFLYWLPESKVAFVLHLVGGDPFNACAWTDVATAEEAQARYDFFFPPEERPSVDEESLYTEDDDDLELNEIAVSRSGCDRLT